MTWWRFQEPLDPRACVLTFDGSTRFRARGREHTLPWDAAAWKEILRTLSTGRPAPEAMQAWGHEIGQVLAPLLRKSSQLVIRSRHRPDDVLRLPWELALADPTRDGRPLRLRPFCSVLRQVVGDRPPAPDPGGGGCMLLAWAGNVPWKHHKEILTLALRRVGGVLEVLGDVSPQRLQTRLQDPFRPVRALHLLAHGVPGTPWKLALEGEDVDAVRLAAALGHRALSLVSLVACQRADDPVGLYGVPLADIARSGVGPVLGSQFELSTAGAEQAFTAFYGALLEKGSLLEALSRACQDMHANRSHLCRPDWAGLVLVTPTQEEV